MRLGRVFAFHKSSDAPLVKFEPIAELFNTLNSNSVTSQVNTVGPKYGTPSAILEGRLLRLGFQIHF
jgi:hypothetical protein